MNTRNRKIAPARPYLFVHCVDEASITVVPTPLTWGCVDIITSEIHYVAGEDKAVITRGGTGIYEIKVALCAEKVSGAPSHIKVELYVNGVALPGAITCGYVGGGLEHASIILIYAGYLNEGDYIQTYISVDAGTAKITAGTGRAIVKGLHMRGWNNNAGGKIDYRGGVMR